MKKCLLLALAFVFALAFGLTGCGNGGGGDGAAVGGGVTTVGGAVAKGPFLKGAKVEVFKVGSDGELITPATWTGTVSSDKGEYSVDLQGYTGPVEVQVTGTYLSEFSGLTKTTNKPLKAVVYAEGSVNTNVNIMTTIASGKIKKYMKLGYAAPDAINTSYGELAQIFDDIVGDGGGESLKVLDLTDLTDEKNAKFMLLNYALLKLQNDDPITLLEFMTNNLSGPGVLDWELTTEQQAALPTPIGNTPITQQLVDIANSCDYTTVINTFSSKIEGFKGNKEDLAKAKIAVKSFKKTTSLGLLKIGDTEVKVSLETKPLGTGSVSIEEKGNKVYSEVISSEYTYAYAETEKGKDSYMFVQPVDKNKTKLELPEEELVCSTCEESVGGQGATKITLEDIQKPVPKTISSADAKTKVVVANMKLKKDITVAVTPYKSFKFIPKVTDIENDTGLKNVQVISGADVNIVDSLGKPTTSDKVCFCGTVSVNTTHVLQGAMELSQLKSKLDNQEGSLYMLVLKNKKWQVVNGAYFNVEQQGGKYALVQASGKTLRLYPFVIVFVPKETIAFSGVISGTVSEAGGVTPVKGALVVLKGLDIFAITGSDGKYQLPYSALKANEPVQLTVVFTKDAYVTDEKVTAVSSSSPNVIVDSALTKQNTFTLSGKILDSNNNPIPNAHVILYYDSFEFDVLSDGSGNYSFELVPVDKKDSLKVVGEAAGYAKSELLPITGQIQQGVLAFDIVLGQKQTKPGAGGYSEGFETELTDKKWTLSNTSPYVGWQVIKNPETIKVAQPIVDQVLFPDRKTIDVTGKVASIFGVAGFGATCSSFTNWPIELPPAQGDLAIPQGVVVTPVDNGFNVSWDPVEGIFHYLVTVNNGSDSVSLMSYTNTISISQTAQDYMEYTKTMNITNGQLYQVAVKSMAFQQPAKQALMNGYYDTFKFSNYSDKKCVIPIGPGRVPVIFTKTSETKPSTALANIEDVNGDGSYDHIKTDFSNFNTAQYQFDLQGAETVGVGTSVLVSYPDPNDKNVPLLPAYEGSYVLWYGSTTTGTISDQESNTSTGPNSGEAISPLLDLTNYNSATAIVHTWFEVESVDVAGGQYDQMEVWVGIFDDDKEPGTQITVWAGSTPYTMVNQEFYKVGTLNPESEPPGMQSSYLNYSSGGVNSAPTWVMKELNLSPLAGHKIKVKFIFYTKDSLYNGFRGWALDDISIVDQKSNEPFIGAGQSLESVVIEERPQK